MQATSKGLAHHISRSRPCRGTNDKLTGKTDQVRKISHDEKGGLLTLGFLTALWSNSTAMIAIIDTLNRAYQVAEGRSW